MQTFLPYSDFVKSAQCLDNRRLGKQRSEVLTILRVLNMEVQAWQNHPAVKMWRGYELWLIAYGIAICEEWKTRGFKDTVKNKLRSYYSAFREHGIPPWLDNDRLHAGHRSNLLRKDYKHYSQFGWTETDDLPYYWPAT